MTTNTNTDSATLNELLDDLLWLYSRNQTHARGLETAVHAMIAEYTANLITTAMGRLSVRSYIPDYAPNVIVWGPFPRPHRRTAETDTSSRTTTFDRDIMVDALGLCTALHKEATGR
jgi:hypothetical protein